MSKHILTSDKDEKIRNIFGQQGIQPEDFERIKTEIIEITKNSIEKLIVSHSSTPPSKETSKSDTILDYGFIKAAKDYYSRLFSGGGEPVSGDFEITSDSSSAATADSMTTPQPISPSPDKIIKTDKDITGLIIGVITNTHEIIPTPFPKYSNSTWEPTNLDNFIITKSESKNLKDVLDKLRTGLSPVQVSNVVIVRFLDDANDFFEKLTEFVDKVKNTEQATKQAKESAAALGLELWSIAEKTSQTTSMTKMM